MSKIYLPYKITSLDGLGTFKFQQNMNVVSTVLSKIPQHVYKRKKQRVYGASAFEPQALGYLTTYNTGSYLRTMKTPPPFGSIFALFIAPIRPVDGTTVTSLKSYWYDGTNKGWVTCRLRRCDFEENTTTLATVTSSSSSGFGTTETTTISNAKIDLSQYTYYIEVLLYFFSQGLPPPVNTDLRFQACKLEYEQGR